MNKKTFKILIWCFAGASLLILIAFLILILAIKISWAWLWVTGIIVGVAWIVFSIIFLIRKLSTPSDARPKINVKDAKEKAINMIKYDEDNADNFKVEKVIQQNRGLKGSPRTPILILYGKGTEKKNAIVWIQNMNNPDSYSFFINPLVDEVAEAIRLTAEEPEDPLIKEKTIESLMPGFPMKTTERTLPAGQQERSKEDEKDAKEKSAV